MKVMDKRKSAKYNVILFDVSGSYKKNNENKIIEMTCESIGKKSEKVH